MPRPVKWRKVCCMPRSDRFGPLNGQAFPDHFLIMTVDEYETIRLIDKEGFTQEECAEQMKIARTTVQRIYNDARKKLAESIVTSCATGWKKNVAAAAAGGIAAGPV